MGGPTGSSAQDTPMEGGGTEIEWFIITIRLLGGVALFLFGMKMLGRNLKAAFGDSLRRVLARFCRNRLTGFVSGAVATAVLSSSTAASVLVVSFVEAGHMTFQEALGVCLGVNVGSTLTAHLVAFKITKYALLLVSLGFFSSMVWSNPRVKVYGDTVLGLGLLFFGLEVMSTAVKPLQTYQPFIDFLGSMSSPLTGIAASTVFTLVVQASAATAGIAIVLAQNGVLSLQAGIAMIIGANVGTCGTSLLSALGKQEDTKRVAVAYLVFKLVGVALWLPFMGLAERVVLAFASGGDTASAIATSHTLFNVSIAVVVLPFLTTASKAMYYIVPKTGLPTSAPHGHAGPGDDTHAVGSLTA